MIPDEAIIKLNVRTFDEAVRKRVLAAIKRIVNAEAEASGAPKPPEITALDRYSLVSNDAEATSGLRRRSAVILGANSVVQVQATSASEDFGSFGTYWGAPSVFWFIGGTDLLFIKRQKPPAACTISRQITIRVSRRLSIRRWRRVSKRCWWLQRPGFAEQRPVTNMKILVLALDLGRHICRSHSTGR